MLILTFYNILHLAEQMFIKVRAGAPADAGYKEKKRGGSTLAADPDASGASAVSGTGMYICITVNLVIPTSAAWQGIPICTYI